MTEPLPLRGCRHDILGHYLKAVGLLRVLARCADKDHCDPDAEGWWDLENGCFCLRSSKYDTRERLTEFFALYYRPTPVFAAWNKEPGCSSEGSEKLGVRSEWGAAKKLSQQVVTAEERKKPANHGKLVASEAFEAYREDSEPSVAEALDAIASPFLRSNSEHPLFLSKGIAGRAHIWRTHWEYLMVFQKHRDAYKKAAAKISENTGTAKQLQTRKENAEAALQRIADLLFADFGGAALSTKGKGTPFFPDAIKSYNIGSSWVTEDYPFNALDYVLAVEGAFAMRGSVGRILAANARRFAAFPFVFDTGEEMVDDSGEVKGLSHSLWLPLWDTPVTFSELSSFVTDAQARLPGKEVRFSAEFIRALYCQGVDAGFAGWQEFRFKMKASRVPWVTTGRYLESRFREDATRLSRALQSLDESRFLDQFEFRRKGSKADPRSPHPVVTTLNDAMEAAIRETTPRRCLELLQTIFAACRKMTVSETFREMLRGEPRFFRPLPMEAWNALFAGFDEREFRIARAVASIVGQRKQANGNYPEVLPMLGSLLPLKLGQNGWYLPSKGDRSYQAVWTATDLCHDLAALLARRYLDSLTDDRPALVSSFGAPLEDVLAFLRGELDDNLIGRWIEALSLIGWKLTRVDERPPERQIHAVPIEYAALRVLLELECEQRQTGDTAKRRSLQPIALLCQRSTSALPLALSEALRWISIWGVPNPDPKSRSEKERLAGRDIIRIPASSFHPTVSATRLAAAVCIPVHWGERDRLFREVCLSQSDT
jgi:CRISPR-associated protein Csx17